MAVERIWDLQSFSGGESDDVYKGPANGFYKGENIEIRKNLSALTLSKGMVDMVWSLIDSEILCIYDLSTFGTGTTGIMVCTSNGKVFVNGASVFTLATSETAWNRVEAIGSVYNSGTHLYLISRSEGNKCKIHRFNPITNAIEPNWGEFAVKVSPTTQHNVSVIPSKGGLFIAAYDTIAYISPTEVITTPLTIGDNESLVGITNFQNVYKLYSNSGTNGVQYTWDGLSASYNGRQQWNGQKILSVVNDGPNDYAVLGYSERSSDLYLIQGTQKQELRVNLELSTNGRQFFGNLSVRQGIVYVSGRNGIGGNASIYTYGNYFAGTNKSIVSEYSLGTTRFLDSCHGEAFSFFACGTKVYKVDNSYSDGAFASNGNVLTNIYQGNFWEEKTIKKINVSFSLVGGSSIKLYARTKQSDSFVLFKTIDYATYSTFNNVTIYASEIASLLDLGTFNEIQIKAELLGNGSTTPTLGRITTFMEVVNQQ